MNRVLGLVLRWFGIMLYRLRLGPTIIRWRWRRVRVLLYHACDERESDYIAGLGSNTTPAEFARHLDFYARHYAVIGMEQLLSGDIPGCAAVITFDDGYRSVFGAAAPLLASRGMTATFFLITDVVDNRAMMWVNELNWLLRRHAVEARAIVAALLGVEPSLPPQQMLFALRRQCTPAEISDVTAEIRRAAGLDAGTAAAEAELYVTWDQVASMQHQYFTFGNHTTMHPSLPRLSPAAQRQVIADAGPVLVAHGCHADWLAYPFGDCDGHSVDAARSAACTLIAEVGVVAGRFNPLHVGRIPVDAATDAELFAQLEVVEPAKAWVRGMTGRR